jgi:hypothetical protein
MGAEEVSMNGEQMQASKFKGRIKTELTVEDSK